MTAINMLLELARISAIMLVLVAAAVYMFVKVGIISSGYSKPKKVIIQSDNKRVEQKMEPFAGIYWIAVAFIYLIPGFLLGYWNKMMGYMASCRSDDELSMRLYEMH